MKRFAFLFLYLFQYAGFGQMQKEAIVVEGKSAVLRKADFTADTVYVLDENEVFLLSDNREGNQDWVEVEIEIDPGKFSKNANGNRESFVVGFIHKSKIQLVDSLPKYERPHLS